MNEPSSARLFATAIGVVLTVTGMLGFFAEASFNTGDQLVTDELLGLIPVNGWINSFYLLTGLAGLILAETQRGARRYAIFAGVIYLVLAGFGIAADSPDTLFSLIGVNTESTVLHFAVGALGLIAYRSSSPQARPTRPAG